jgi:ABC-type oligopeptide transport system substrate-binding subunit
MTIMSRTSNLYPDPRQYFGSIFTESKNNNNVWAFGSPKTDELIEIYEKNMDKPARVAAMCELDAILQDEAFYVPFWQAPFVRFLYWDGLQFPDFYWPRRFEQEGDWQVYWIDQTRQDNLMAAMKSNTPLQEDLSVDQDPYGVKAVLEKSMSQVTD